MNRPCNRCDLIAMKHQSPGLAIKSRPSPGFPNDVEVLDDELRCIRWFAEVPEECACHE